MTRFKRMMVALVALVSLGGAVAATTGGTPVQAYATSGRVDIFATIAGTKGCNPGTTGGWVWYQDQHGDSGWANKGWSGTSALISFSIYNVPPAWSGQGGTVLTIRWGVRSNGRDVCTGAAYRVIQRPCCGYVANLGRLD